MGSRTIPQIRATRIIPPVQPPITEETHVTGVRVRFTADLGASKAGQWFQLPNVGPYLIGSADKTWYSFKSITFWAPPKGSFPGSPQLRAIRFENNYQEMVYQVVVESDGSTRGGINFPLWYRQKALTQSDATIPVQLLTEYVAAEVEVLLEYTARMVPAKIGYLSPSPFDPDCPSIAPEACEPTAPPAETVGCSSVRRFGPFTYTKR